MRAMCMGVVIEYAGQHGKPQWSKPPSSAWDYTVFGTSEATLEPDQRFNLVFEKIPGGHGGFNRWTINGKSWPDVDPLSGESRPTLPDSDGKQERRRSSDSSSSPHF